MVEIIRADLHNPRHGEALIAMLDEYARDEMGGGNALADEVKANLADALAARVSALRPDWWVARCRLGGPWPDA